MTAVIVDDEQLAREELRYLLDAAGGVEVIAQGQNGIEAVDLIRTHHPDIVFLDVQMPGLDGFAVIKKLLEKDRQQSLPQIIFATAFDQYAVRAFDVNAIDYLLKPFDRGRVHQALERARQRLHEAPPHDAEPSVEPGAPATHGTAPASVVSSADRLDALLRLMEQQSGPRPRSGKIVVETQSRLLLVDQNDICFASIEDGTISVVTPNLEGHSKCRTLEELLDLLDPSIFWRAHRSFVVNINHIKEVVPWFKSSYQLRMADRKRTEVPVSRAQTRRLRELFKL